MKYLFCVIVLNFFELQLSTFRFLSLHFNIQYNLKSNLILKFCLSLTDGHKDMKTAVHIPQQ